jgi:hypothetical protein
MTTLSRHSKNGKLLNGFRVEGGGRDVRFGMAIVVGRLELGLLVTIGLRV